MTAVEWLIEQMKDDRFLSAFEEEIEQAKEMEKEQMKNGCDEIFERAKEMEKEQKILLVQQLKNYTYDSQCILGNDDREAIEFVDIFDNETLKSE